MRKPLGSRVSHLRVQQDHPGHLKTHAGPHLHFLHQWCRVPLGSKTTALDPYSAEPMKSLMHLGTTLIVTCVKISVQSNLHDQVLIFHLFFGTENYTQDLMIFYTMELIFPVSSFVLLLGIGDSPLGTGTDLSDLGRSPL